MEPIEFEHGSWGTKATIRAPWQDSMLRLLVNMEVNDLHLNTGKGWKGKVDFLSHLPHLQSLVIIDQGLDSLEPVHTLNKLVRLSLSTYSDTPINFDSFPELEICDFEWIRGSQSLFSRTSLRRLGLNSYKGKSSSGFSNLTRLDTLSIGNTSIKELAGLGALENLSYLSLFNLRSLTAIDGIGELRKLKVLEMQRCPKIDEVTKIFQLESLEQLLLLDMGRIESIRGIEKLTDLQAFLFYGSSDVEDGDLSPLTMLSKLSVINFRDRNHYTHKLEDFKVQKFLPPRMSG